MSEQGIIERSLSLRALPVVLVKEKDGSTRFYVNYGKLNDLTKKNSFPLPRIDNTHYELSVSSWISTLDLKRWYWQVEIAEDHENTAFSTGNGLWQLNVMPFGLCNAPATFERLMESALGDLLSLIYLDDIIVHASTFDEGLERLRLQ